MSDDNRLGRRRLLQLSGGLVGAALLPATASAQDGSDDFVTNGATPAGVGAAPTLEPLGRYVSGAPFDEGGSEIPAYDAETQRAFVTNGNEGAVDVIDVGDPTDPTLAGTVEVDGAFDGADAPTNVAVMDGTLAAAIEAEDTQANGAVGFYDTETLDELAVVEVGPLPDMVAFTPDGSKALAANEGEPTDDYSEDPRGSVSVVDLSDGFESVTVATAGFESFVGREEELREDGVRIYGPEASAAQDFEPEYVAVAPDSETAYVTLQENNAIGIVDVDEAEVTDVVGLGYKDFSESGNELDLVEDDEIDIRNWPVYGMYQPDVIEAYEVDGETYLVIANEGDAREYDAIFETGVLTEVDGEYGLDTTEDDGDNVDVPVDASQFEDGVLDALLGIEATTETGDVDDDGELEELYVFGGRSFSVLDSDGRRVSESGSEFEEIVARTVPEQFNAENDENGIDGESTASGPEPEGVALGGVAGHPFAFVGFEEVGGFAVYDVGDPTAPQFVQYLNTRDFSLDPEDIEESIENDDSADDLPADAAGDLGPEGLAFVPAADSPIVDPLLIAGYEVSGTTTVYRIETDVVGIDSVALRNGATGTVDLSVLAAMDGFSGARLTVSVSDPAVATITGVEYGDALALTRSPRISGDGSSVELAVADTEKSVQPGATDLTLATLELEGTGAGTADLTVEIADMDDEDGQEIDAVPRNGLVVTGPPAVGSGPGGNAPTDPDGDGVFEDVNGNGRMDYDDVTLLFEEFDSDAVKMNVDAYDFNENGQLDYDDVVDLYEEIN